jgi:hypothetical protein
LSGKKTYITAAFLAVITFARYLNWIDQELFEFCMGLLGSAGLAALRAGVAKTTV